MSIAEFISGDGKEGSLCVMFKGKQIKGVWTELLNTGHDDPSKWSGIEMNGKEWKTNEVDLRWCKEKFTTWAKKQLRGRYYMIIIDGRISHVSHEFIKYCAQNEIVALCFLLYITQILQPLDVGIFGPLANA